MATEIYDWNDLDAAIQGTNGSEDTGDYVLQNDLDSSTAGYSGIGDSWQPCGYNVTGSFDTGFHGTFDGGGNEIRDLVIDDSSHDTSNRRIGLFGSTDGSGGAARIENLGVSGEINTTNNTRPNAGLLVGAFYGDEIRNCYAYGTVNAPNMSDVGGIAGFNTDSIVNCYSLVAVTGGSEVGGLCGDSRGSIETTYSAGSVSGSSTVEGFVGNQSGSQTDTYYDTQTSGQTGGTAAGLTTSDMQGASASTNLGGFDFSGTWDTVPSGNTSSGDPGYPILQAPDRDAQYTAQGLIYDPVLNPTLTMGGDDIVEISIDGTAVTGLTIDGDAVE